MVKSVPEKNLDKNRLRLEMSENDFRSQTNPPSLQCLTAQELADDDSDIEKPVKALLTQLRMTAAKRRLRNAVKSPFDDAFISQNSEFFAKGRLSLIFNHSFTIVGSALPLRCPWHDDRDHPSPEL